MAHEVRAVVARAMQQPVEVVTIEVPDPGPGEALVRVQACGVCHTDLHYREGGINDEFPFLAHHEDLIHRPVPTVRTGGVGAIVLTS
jgi:S-(hydroxymethyl)mycothiol dehydrogenase